MRLENSRRSFTYFTRVTIAAVRRQFTEDEFSKWCTDLRPLVGEGSGRARKKAQKMLQRFLAAFDQELLRRNGVAHHIVTAVQHVVQRQSEVTNITKFVVLVVQELGDAWTQLWKEAHDEQVDGTDTLFDRPFVCEGSEGPDHLQSEAIDELVLKYFAVAGSKSVPLDDNLLMRVKASWSSAVTATGEELPMSQPVVAHLARELSADEAAVKVAMEVIANAVRQSSHGRPS